MDARAIEVFNSLILTFSGAAFVCLFLAGFAVLLLVAIVNRVSYQKANIMTDGELRFYKVLKFAASSDFDILSQVRLANVVKIRDRYFMWKRFNLLGAKCVDFVLIDKSSGETKLVIELDDKSHRLPERIRRDRFVDGVLKNSGVKILHLPYQGYYKTEEIREKVLGAINS